MDHYKERDDLSPEEIEFDAMLDHYDQEIEYIQMRLDTLLSDTPFELKPSPMHSLRPMGTKNWAKVDGREYIAELKEQKENYITKKIEDSTPAIKLKLAGRLHKREQGEKTDVDRAGEQKDIQGSQGFAAYLLNKRTTPLDKEKTDGSEPAPQTIDQMTATFFASLGSSKMEANSEMDKNREDLDREEIDRDDY